MVVLTNFKWFFILLGIAVICAILVITYKLDSLGSTPKEKKVKSKQRKTTEKVLIEDEELKETLTEDDLYEGLRNEYSSIDESIFDDRELNNYYKASEYSKKYRDTDEINENNFDEYTVENENNNEEEFVDENIDMFNHLNMESEQESFDEQQDDEENSFDDDMDMFNHLNMNSEQESFEEQEDDNEEDLLDDVDMFNHLDMDDDFEENESVKEKNSFDQTMVFDNIRENTNKNDEFDPVVEQIKNFVEPEESNFEFFTTTSKTSKSKRINSNTENEIKSVEKNQTEIESNDFLNEMEMTLMKNRENRRNRKSIITSSNIKEKSLKDDKEETIKKSSGSKITKKVSSKEVPATKKTAKKSTTKKTTDDKKSTK